MPTLTPFYSNVQVYEHKGRFPVQLEVPEHSTLTSDEIEQILELASWDSNPNKRDDILFEGGRSFLFPGKNERNVQLGGTSYLPIHYIPDFIGFGYIDRAPGVLPPSTKNYIDCLPGNIMGTSFGEGWNLCHSRPTYRATGSYTEPELREKVKKTFDAMNMDFTFGIPPMQAYGRFTSPELTADCGSLGFTVQTLEDPLTIRLYSFLKTYCNRLLREENEEDAYQCFRDQLLETAHLFGEVTREIHLNGLAHLQLHLSNVYVNSNKEIFVTDWATSRKLNGDSLDNTINRIVDLSHPHQFMTKMLLKRFPSISSERHGETSDKLGEKLHRAYAASSVSFKDFFNLSRSAPFIASGMTMCMYDSWFEEIDRNPFND